MSTSEQPASTAAAAPAPAGKPTHRLRNLVLIVVGFVALLGLVAGGLFAYSYDKATAIDRSTPEVVTEQFLDASVKHKDSARIALFICSDWTVGAAQSAVSAPSDPRIRVTWGDFVVAIAGREAKVAAQVALRIDVPSGYQQQIETWTLSLRQEDGWRVCSLTKAQSLNP